MMEYLKGEDYSVYCLSIDGEALVVLPMKRNGLMPGYSAGGTLINNADAIQYCKNIVRALHYTGAINIQLMVTRKGPLLYEINPRISATTVIALGTGINSPYLLVLIAAGENDKVRRLVKNAKIRWGLKLLRTHRELFVYKDSCEELT